MIEFNAHVNNALLLLDSAIEDIETGFILCENCGERESTKDLAFVEEIKEARDELVKSAMEEPTK